MADTNSTVFLTPPDEPGALDYSMPMSQNFTQHSESNFEGVYSQDWNQKDDNESEWIELNRLRQELFPFSQNEEANYSKEKVRKMDSREVVTRTIKWLMNHFRGTKEPILMLTRGKWVNISFNQQSGIHLKTETVQHTNIGLDKRARMLALLCRIYLNLKSNRFSTKRELYYKDKKLYEKQYICDSLIEDLCCVTYYSRKQLHIISCPKGLIYGRLQYKINGTLFNCMEHSHGLTISQNIDLVQEIQSDAKFILVIEKDASFQHLINCKVVDKFPAILITGRGFPDADTRRFVKHLVQELKIPVLGLADANPWGLEIMCIYRYGSVSMAHEAENLVELKLKWLGFLPSDLIQFDISADLTEELSENDRSKIASLRKRPYIAQNKPWADELTLMEGNGRKAELQALDNFVEVYLPWKIKEGRWL